MDKRVYEKTRYQNIYRHKKNKNYVIMMSKPVKTSISRIGDKKIMTTEDAIKVRDNIVLKKQKATETLNKETFDELWYKYMFWCETIAKMAYNTTIRKQKMYNKYLKEKIKENVAKTKKEFWANYINKLMCSDKQKNQLLKELNSFFNWCVKEEYLLYSPTKGIPKYKIEKPKMKYWLPEELKKFIETVSIDLESKVLKDKEMAYRVKVLTLIGFSLGDRIGETRALTFNNIDKEKKVINIEHSINYDLKSSDYTSHTKTYFSQRTIDITDKLIELIFEYKEFLNIEMHYNVKDSDLIFFNHITEKPFSDVALRKIFYKYCDKANVPRIRMYDLRHTYVATMMSEGLELYHISERLGHTNYNTTVNKYGHLSNEKRKEIAKTTDKYY